MRPTQGVGDLTTAASHRARTVVSAWLGGRLLSPALPLVSGQLSVNGDQTVPEAVTVAFPAVVDGESLIPTATDAPLACNGQRLRLQRVIEVGDSLARTIDLGTYVLADWETDGDVVTATARGLLSLVEEDDFTRPFKPAASFTATLRKLVPHLPVEFDGLTDRTIRGSGVAFTDSRIDALYDLLDAWPALCRVTPQGSLRVFKAPTAGATSLMTIRGGPLGTLVQANSSGTRADRPNVVVVNGTGPGAARPPIRGERSIGGTDPMAPDGPYGRVVQVLSSSTADTVAELEATADAVLARSIRQVQPRTAEVVPDGRVEHFDVVTLDDGRLAEKGIVTRYALPLTAADGPMTLTVGRIGAS